MRKNRLIIPALLAFLSLQGYAQELNDSITSGKPAKYSDEVVEIGYHKAQRLRTICRCRTYIFYSWSTKFIH